MDGEALGPLMIDVEGLTLNEEDRRCLRHANVGGVILFSRNYRSRSQLQALADDIHGLRAPPLLIAVDQEGGRVQRIRDGFTQLPAARSIGRSFDDDAELGITISRAAGWVMATELKAIGIDMSFAPVLDCALTPSEVIGDRAFHSDPRCVATLARAFVEGMHRAGMPAVGKHFPGHGGVGTDSHVELPADTRKLDALEDADMIPYRELITDGLDAVMTAHVCYAQIDADVPTYSRFWLKTVLRERLGFTGVVFSDDLSMHGAACVGDPVVRAQRALAAGCDMVLVCNDREGANTVIETLHWHPSAASQHRLAQLCARVPGQSLTPGTQDEWQRALQMLGAVTDR